MDFDETRIYYSHQQLQVQQDDGDDSGEGRRGIEAEEEDTVDLDVARRHFREFLRNYRHGPQRFLYRDKLLRMHRRNSSAESVSEGGGSSSNKKKLEVDLAHIGEYDPSLLGFLQSQPAQFLPALELAAADALKTLLFDLRQNRADGGDGDAPDDADETQVDDDVHHDGANITSTDAAEPEILYAMTPIQVLLRGNLSLTPLRGIKSEHMNKLIKCSGIVISTSPVNSRATASLVRCHRCLDTKIIPSTGGPFSGVSLPRSCGGAQPQDCGSYPYAVVPDESHFVDRQTWKLQESPETVPTGEMPRSILMAVERSLVDLAPPGTRVQVMCIPSLFQAGGGGGGADRSVKTVYLRVIGLQRDNAGGDAALFTPREEEAFRRLAKSENVYGILSRSLAPSISGNYTHDIKKALVCMLLGGCRKRLPDGAKLRGDINVLLLGDPSTAKSQFLKFASKVAPIGIYTSGKGSSAAGLTASVVRDTKGEFYLEGGAMVLADGGIVAIDEFDKMRPSDRVAIHEAMEQQTISVAKAGITTVLNSRSSVLAAANPVFGRYDELKTASEQIDLMTTILSRFDLIFLVRDIRQEERDRMICEHVMGVHMENSKGGRIQSSLSDLLGANGAINEAESASSPVAMDTINASAEAIADHVLQVATTGQGELTVPAFKKFVQYCKAKCSPRLTDEAGDVLASAYVRIRDDVRKNARPDDGEQAVIPITVRQLEALVRISESLAKMRLDEEVQTEDVEEALRLFRVSTMAANSVDNQAHSVAATRSGNPQEMERSERFLRARLVVGAMVNKNRLMEEAAAQGLNIMTIAKAVSVMVMRGEVQERNQGRLLRRIK